MIGRIGFTVAVGIALLVLAAPASATHVACGDTITTDTTLDSDLSCGDADAVGLNIQASNVTLRLAGHYIFGSPSDVSDIGVYAASAYDGITIRGATGGVQSFRRQIVLEGDDNSVRRTNMGSLECAGTRGIQMTGARGYAYRNVVEWPFCYGPDTNGIELGEEGYAWGNHVSGGDNGIVATGDKTRAIGNTISTCYGRGIHMSGYSTGAWASYNSAFNCTIGIDGDAADGGGGPSGNGRYGHNTVSGFGDGMNVADGSAIVARNTANDNTGAGIVTTAAGTVVKNNTANDNGTYGINAAAGTVDGGGNTATGNGTADCVNVSCP
jgi:parallel beta-helix repeat protein